MSLPLIEKIRGAVTTAAKRCVRKSHAASILLLNNTCALPLLALMSLCDAPSLGAGLIVDWNVERANIEPNNVAVVSKHSRCCKEDPEMKQSDEPI
jgi:hypothetical protein